MGKQLCFQQDQWTILNVLTNYVANNWKRNDRVNIPLIGFVLDMIILVM